jgi:hypothetical protein
MKKLSMSQTLTYQIKIPGIVEEKWLAWGETLKVSSVLADKRNPITTLTGKFDQAALIGLLRQINSLGLPLISVICIDASIISSPDD